MTPIFASTACCAGRFTSLSAQLEAYVAAGIDGIELGWAPPAGPNPLPGQLRAFSARWLVHNYFPAPEIPFLLNLASQDRANLDRSRQFASDAIRLAAALGAPFYSVHSGFLAEFDPVSLGRKLSYHEIIDYEQGYATFLESIRQLLEVARAAGIRLLVEPNVVAPFNLIDGRNTLLMMAEPNEFTRFLSDVPDDRLGVLMDLGHLNVTATTLAFRREEFITAVAGAVGAFHLHDNDGSADQHRPSAEGSWTLEVLRDRQFAGKPVIVEAKFDSQTALAKHCFWLKSLLNHPL